MSGVITKRHLRVAGIQRALGPLAPFFRHFLGRTKKWHQRPAQRGASAVRASVETGIKETNITKGRESPDPLPSVIYLQPSFCFKNLFHVLAIKTQAARHTNPTAHHDKIVACQEVACTSQGTAEVASVLPT